MSSFDLKQRVSVAEDLQSMLEILKIEGKEYEKMTKQSHEWTTAISNMKQNTTGTREREREREGGRGEGREREREGERRGEIEGEREM